MTVSTMTHALAPKSVLPLPTRQHTFPLRTTRAPSYALKVALRRRNRTLALAALAETCPRMASVRTRSLNHLTRYAAATPSTIRVYALAQRQLTLPSQGYRCTNGTTRAQIARLHQTKTAAADMRSTHHHEAPFSELNAAQPSRMNQQPSAA